jgi:hypothetical protein
LCGAKPKKVRILLDARTNLYIFFWVRVFLSFSALLL